MAEKSRSFTWNVLLPWLVRKLAGTKSYPTEADAQASGAI